MIFLLREPREQILSKLNDEASKFRRIRWFGMLYELFVVIYFSLENFLIRKKIKQLSKRNDIKLIVINYRDLVLDLNAVRDELQTFLGYELLFQSDIRGKTSSYKTGKVPLRKFSKFLFNLIHGV